MQKLAGASNGNAKLTEELVREIRDLYASGASVQSLVETYGMSTTATESVVHRRSWRHVV